MNQRTDVNHLNMTKLPKLFLFVSAVSFVGGAVSLTIPGIAAAWTVGVPLGAIFLGLFLIALMLQNEVVRFDAEQRAKIESAEHSRRLDATGDIKPSRGEARQPQRLAAVAASH
jgi:hypothetical protein